MDGERVEYHVLDDHERDAESQSQHSAFWIRDVSADADVCDVHILHEQNFAVSQQQHIPHHDDVEVSHVHLLCCSCALHLKAKDSKSISLRDYNSHIAEVLDV